jgi:hypothetical protein
VNNCSQIQKLVAFQHEDTKSTTQPPAATK